MVDLNLTIGEGMKLALTLLEAIDGHDNHKQLIPMAVIFPTEGDTDHIRFFMKGRQCR